MCSTVNSQLVQGSGEIVIARTARALQCCSPQTTLPIVIGSPYTVESSGANLSRLFELTLQLTLFIIKVKGFARSYTAAAVGLPAGLPVGLLLACLPGWPYRALPPCNSPPALGSRCSPTSSVHVIQGTYLAP